MYAISDVYTEYLKRRSREWLVKVEIDGIIYDSSVIVDFEIENSLALNEEFEIGTAILSKLTLRLKTTDVIAANAKVIPYLALLPPLSGANAAWQDQTDTWDAADYPWQGMTEWLPLGEFYIDSREQINTIWEFTCYDKLVWADVPYISALTYPATMQAVWDEICDSLGYTYDSSVVIDPNYMIEVGPAGYSKRQVLGYIASANSASVYVGKDGIVRFRKFSAADDKVFEMTASDYIRAEQTNPEKTFTRIVVTYNTDDNLSYSAGTGDENHTLYVTNPFATQAMTDDLLAALNGFSYIPAIIDARGYPQIEAGDRIRFGAYVDTPTWDAADATWEDAEYSWDGYTSGGQTIALHTVYSFRGGLKMSVEAQSKSEQQSEFVVEGTLTAQVNSLNKNAVREGRDYFGATLTREDGLIIEREDHASKVTLNSDAMKWEVDGAEKLYYDAVAGKLKFVGDIVMEGGSISWASITGPDYTDIEGVKPPSNADNTFDTIGAGRLDNINSIGEYIGQLSQGQVDGLSTRLTKITPTGVYTGTIGTDQLVAQGALIGSALIETLTVGDNVQIGTAQDADGVTTIIGNTVDTGFVNALNVEAATVKADWVYAGSINAGQINASTLSAISANLGTVTAGSLTTNTTINVGTDVTIGNNLFVGDDVSGVDRTIYLKGHWLKAFNNGDDLLLQSIIDLYLQAARDMKVSSALGTMTLDGSIDFPSTATIDFTGATVIMPQKADNFGGISMVLRFDATNSGYSYIECTYSNGILVAANSVI